MHKLILGMGYESFMAIVTGVCDDADDDFSSEVGRLKKHMVLYTNSIGEYYNNSSKNDPERTAIFKYYFARLSKSHDGFYKINESSKVKLTNDNIGSYLSKYMGHFKYNDAVNVYINATEKASKAKSKAALKDWYLKTKSVLSLYSPTNVIPCNKNDSSAQIRAFIIKIMNTSKSIDIIDPYALSSPSNTKHFAKLFLSQRADYKQIILYSTQNISDNNPDWTLAKAKSELKETALLHGIEIHFCYRSNKYIHDRYIMTDDMMITLGKGGESFDFDKDMMNNGVTLTYSTKQYPTVDQMIGYEMDPLQKPLFDD